MKTCPRCGYDIHDDEFAEHDEFCEWGWLNMRGRFDKWRDDDRREQDRIADVVQGRCGKAGGMIYE